MHKLKSFLAALMAMVVVVAMALPVFAAPDNKIQINGEEQASSEDPEVSKDTRFTAYQIFKGTVGGDNGRQLVNVTWGDAIEGDNLISAMKSSGTMLQDGETTFGTKFTEFYDGIKGEYGTNKLMTDAEVVARFLGDFAGEEATQLDSTVADTFARLAQENLKGSAPSKQSTKRGDGTGWEIDVTDPGYYLVIDGYKGDTEHYGSASSYILEVIGIQNVDLKASLPTVTKGVGSTTGATEKGYIAETNVEDVTFTLTGTVANNIEEYSTYYYEFVDTLSKGLDIDEGSIKVTVDDEEMTLMTDYTVNVEEEKSGPPEETPTGRHILHVVLSDVIESLDNANGGVLSDASKIVVTYTAKLDSNAVAGNAGNPNSVYAIYSDNPYSTDKGKTASTEVKTYTMSLQLKKTDESGAGLDSAGFKLKKRGVEPEQYAVLDTVDGKYVIKEWKTDIAEATEMTPSGDGSFAFLGFEIGQYTLIESKTPENYDTMKDLDFTVAGGAIGPDGSLGKVTLTVDNTRDDYKITNDDNGLNDNAAVMQIINFKASILPHTGGMGTAIMYFASALILGTGIVIFATSRKKRGQKQA